MELSRCSYTIMGILRTKNATDKIHGLTIKEIASLERVSKSNTIHKKVKEMEELGYIKEGVKAGRGKTYFLTDIALEILPDKKEEESNV